MVIDTHTHFYDPSRPQGVPWPPADNAALYRTVLPRHFREVSAAHGVTGTVVVEASPWVEDNQWILDLAEEEPLIVGFVGRLDPAAADLAAHLQRFAANPLFRGIRIGTWNRPDLASPTLLDGLRRLADHDLSLDTLARPETLPGIAALAGSVPALRIVINHVAEVRIDGGPPDPTWMEGIRRAAQHPNVYCKVSALAEATRTQPAPTQLSHYIPTLDALWEAFGEDRLIYGSNWPVCEPYADYGTVFRLVGGYFQAKGAVAAAKYFRENGRAAYRWVER